MSSVKNIDTYINTLDTYIDVMKEEIARLSGMIESLNNKIKETETEKEQLIKEQNEPEFKRVENNASYYSVQLDDGCRVVMRREEHWSVDDNCYNLPNYFYTKERAQEVLDKIKFLLELERLHDMYCYNYKAEDDGNDKYRIVFCDGMYQWETDNYTIDFLSVYFPTKEIAQKVCDILNREE